MYLIYSLLLALAALLAFPWFLFQGLRHGKYLASFRARLGRVPASARASCPPVAAASRALQGDAIWLHAVSVGELLACQGLAAALKQRFPSRPLVISTITETGFRMARQRQESGALPAEAVFFCPFDFPFAVRRVLAQVRPALLVVAETEFWPNLFREAERAGVRVAVVNARVSDRAFPRYRLFRFFFRDVLNRASLLLAQSEEDARRLRELGGDPGRVCATGNLKYDQPRPPSLPVWLDRQVMQWTAPGALLAASTAAGEEGVVLEVFERLRRQWPALRLILAPRRPERFEEVGRMALGRGLRLARRSQLQPEGHGIHPDAAALLLDTVGELGAFYRYATVAFVGGSLVPHGGQNILEAALFARPIVVGPYTHNFREITASFLKAGALRQVASGAELASALEELLRSPKQAEAMGVAARQLLEANRGSTGRTLEAVAELLEEGQPRLSRSPAGMAI